nr:WRKY87 [Glycyrrhiza glabra]
MDYYFGNPNPPNPYYGHQYSAVNIAPSSDNFMVSDYLMLDDDDVVNVDHHHHQDSNWSQSTETESSENKAGSSDANIHGFGDETSPNNNNIKRKKGIMKSTAEVSPRRITFRTRSQLEIMDDGYKWRKYGKKAVKNSPNPR